MKRPHFRAFKRLRHCISRVRKGREGIFSSRQVKNMALSDGSHFESGGQVGYGGAHLAGKGVVLVQMPGNKKAINLFTTYCFRWPPVAAGIQFLWLVRRIVKPEFELTVDCQIIEGNFPSLNNSAGRQHSLLSPLDCLSAKAGGAVNGGAYAPFILTVGWLGWLCYALKSMKIKLFPML